MQKRLIFIFQNEIDKQSEYALISIDYIDYYLQKLTEENSNKFIWYFVQNFLTSSADVSKLLWGSKKEENIDRKELRESLNIDDKSVLFSKKLRNHFEHYDERIESWFRESRDKNYADSNIAPTNSIIGLNEEDFLRNFDTTKMAITFKGEVYELRPLVDELIMLKKTVSEVINNR